MSQMPNEGLLCAERYGVPREPPYPDLSEPIAAQPARARLAPECSSRLENHLPLWLTRQERGCSAPRPSLMPRHVVGRERMTGLAGRHVEDPCFFVSRRHHKP